MIRLQSIFFLFNDTATTEIYTLSLHDALPISVPRGLGQLAAGDGRAPARGRRRSAGGPPRLGGLRSLQVTGWRAIGSEEHTSELQSRQYLVCRLLLEKTKSRLPFSSCKDTLVS